MNRKKTSAIDLLPFHIAEQGFSSAPPLDVAASVRKELGRVGLLDDVKPGQTVLLTAGSRGIDSMVQVLATLSREIRKRGAKPLILPAMGSHGGGTAQGQIEVLRHLGQTETTLGAPIHDQLESVQIGSTDKFPVVADRVAIHSDHIILVNRVKEHTEFIGTIESGLLKMAVVGLGRAAGAEAMHQLAVKRTYQKAIIDIARVLFEKLPVRGGIAILEDKNNTVRRIEAVPAADVFEREPHLLDEARGYHAFLPFDDLDVLLVDEIGKEISGAGFDTKVIGRIMNIYEKECEKPRITRIALRDLSKKTGGNALGLGLADFVHKRIVDKMDPAMTALNAITACAPEKGRVPIWFNSDREMVEAAFLSIGPWDPDSVRAVWIINTADLKELAVSRALIGEARSHGLKVSKDSFRLHFNAKGNLPGLRKVLAERNTGK
jgi:hypothetical protein